MKDEATIASVAEGLQQAAQVGTEAGVDRTAGTRNTSNAQDTQE